jgi:hypothetical protein
VVTAIIIGVLVLLSLILTASVVFPNMSGADIEAIFVAGAGLGLAVGAHIFVQSRLHRGGSTAAAQSQGLAATKRPSRRSNWRMPPLSILEPPIMSTQRKVGMLTLRGYLLFAFVLVIVKVVDVAIAK